MSKDSGQNLVRVEIIAQLFGVTVRRVQQLTQESIISTVAAKDDKGRATRKYDLLPTVQRYISYLSEKAYGKNKMTDKESELKEQTMKATLKIKELEAQLKDVNLKIKDGRYIPRDDVIADYIEFFTVFKKFTAGLPAKITSMLSGLIKPLELRRIRKEVAQEITQQLTSFVISGVIENNKPVKLQGKTG